MKRYLPGLVIILLSLTASYEVLTSWRGKVLAQKGLTKETLLRATDVDPLNPEPYYKLGILHQWNLMRLDLKESAEYLQKAIERNPLEQEYWLSGHSPKFDSGLR